VNRAWIYGTRRPVPFLLFNPLSLHFSLSLHPNCQNWSPNYSVLVFYQVILIATNVTVEPAVFVIELAGKMDEVAIKDMLLYKTCIHDFNETDAICNDLLNDTNHDLNEAVQNEVHKYIIYS
jgi:hypothetical protein